MIDIHSHILPHFDDGAETLDESIEMARHSVEGGVTAVFATPHVRTQLEIDAVRTIGEKVAILRESLRSRGIHLDIVPGAEVYPLTNIPELIDRGLPITLAGGRHILLDTPLTTMPTGLEDLVFALQSRGLTPILAHPERCLAVQRDPYRLEPLIQRGMLVQVDAGCLLGRQGAAPQCAAIRLLKYRWVHFVASDAHSAHHGRPILAAAARAIADLNGQEAAAELVRGNGERVMLGETVPTNPSEYRSERASTWFGRLLAAAR